MQRRVVVGLLAACLIVTGCAGSDESVAPSTSENFSDAVEIGGTSGGWEESDKTENSTKSDPKSDTKNTVAAEMLIYSCDVQIDTLDYEKSVKSFKQRLKELGGFVEEEQYSDGAGVYGYYVEESEKKKNYAATVRIPSDKWEVFTSSMEDLGDVRSQTSTVQNVSQEYHDNDLQLEILEAKEKVFLKMLRKATTTEEMLSIENTLTSLKVQIEQLKSRQTRLEMDVKFSYVTIHIQEVEKYQEVPKETDTFRKRLLLTVTETVEGFRAFLEWLLFCGIRLLPYMCIGFVVGNAIRAWKRKHPRKEKKKAVYQAPMYPTKSIHSSEDLKQGEVVGKGNEENEK